jgi:hypothetical protein
VQFALDLYDTVKSTDGRLLAVPKAGGAAIELRSLSSTLSGDIYRARNIALSKSTIGTAVDTLCGLTASKAPSDVYLRSAHRRSTVHLDLGDHTNEVVRILPSGWSLVSEERAAAAEAGEEMPFCPMFRRTATIRPLPVPVESRNAREEFADILGLSLADQRFHLLWGWLVASVFTDVPRPALWLTGPQGSGKTTAGLIALSVISPTERMGGNFAKNERDDLALIGASFIPSWDNLTTISQQANDFLCRMVTGSETSSRRLYTDDEVHLTTVMRTAVFSSINLPIGLREDGLERIIHLPFDRIAESERALDGDIRRRFREAHPRILGCLLHDVAGVLRCFEEARDDIRGRMPRMADYATILHALDLSLAVYPQYGRFLSAYRDSLRTSMADRALDDPFTTALLTLVNAKQGRWSGSMTDLFDVLSQNVFRPDDPKVFWPSSARQLGNTLRTHSESLRAIGVTVNTGRRDSQGRSKVTLTYTAPDGQPLDTVSDEYLEQLLDDGDARALALITEASTVDV